MLRGGSMKISNYSIVLLIAWCMFTIHKWVPSMWSKSALIKFLSTEHHAVFLQAIFFSLDDSPLKLSILINYHIDFSHCTSDFCFELVTRSKILVKMVTKIVATWRVLLFGFVYYRSFGCVWFDLWTST